MTPADINPIIDGAPFMPLIRTTIKAMTDAQREAQIRMLLSSPAAADLKPEERRLYAEDAVRRLREKEEAAECWYSPQYTVLAYRNIEVAAEGWPPMDWLSIRRDDRLPVRDWRHMQMIKNQLCGPDREGCEIYPAESRLVDTANQYHMFVFREPDAIWPFGFNERIVMDTPDLDKALGAKQRAFTKGGA